jgi:cobalt-zinc-cadmium efflux system outer membrane protein
MLRTSMLGGLVFVALISAAIRPARAQLTASLADDLILLTQRLRGKEAQRTHEHIGPGPGSMENPFPVMPGDPQPLGSEPSRASTPGQANITPPPSLTPAPMPTPLYGVLEIPAIADEGPPNGMTLDQAIERLVQCNPDLRTRFKQLPKAQADIVTAGMRNNPFLFGDVGPVPYGSYSPQLGGVVYEVVVIQAWDVNQKRRRRIRVAQSARNVVEYLYQDSVRLEIDNLYTAFLDVLAAREALRQQQVGLEGLEEIVKATRRQLESAGTITQGDLDRVLVQRDSAFLAVQQAQAAVRRASQTLALLLNIPPNEVDCFDVRGALGGDDLELPSLEQLLTLALQVRPDLNAYRLGVQRAENEVQLAKADRFNDVFLLYTPWALQANSALHEPNATSWSFGALVTLPLFNRNQGNISRAQITVSQTLIELEGRQQQVIADVRRAYQEYGEARKAVQYYQENILPRARRFHEDKLRRLETQKESVLAYFEAQREYNNVVRGYLEASVRLRRDALRLNTAVGQRLVP